jgi:NitT/TauT family transport system substrate-binding protein
VRRFLALLLLMPAASRASVPLTYYQDWFPGAQFAGIYTAIDRGFYSDAGIDLTVHPFGFGQNVPALMDADPSRASIGTIEGYILLQKRAKGADLRALSAVLRESPAGYMSLPGRPIASARDLVGLRVGVHKYGDPLYRLFLKRAGVDAAAATMVFVDDDVGRLVRGEVDVMQGYAIEELVKLRRVAGPGACFISFRDLGFDAYSQVIFATATQLRAHPGELRAFVDATRRGWAFALAHPDPAVDSVMSRCKPGTDRALMREMFLASAPIVSPAGEQPLGPMSLPKWGGMSAACAEMGLVPRPEDPSAFVAAQ